MWGGEGVGHRDAMDLVKSLEAWQGLARQGSGTHCQHLGVADCGASESSGAHPRQAVVDGRRLPRLKVQMHDPKGHS
jgi:hypothetical protein